MRHLTDEETKVYSKILKAKNIKKIPKDEISYKYLKEDLESFEDKPTFTRYLRLIANYDYNVFHPNKYFL